MSKIKSKARNQLSNMFPKIQKFRIDGPVTPSIVNPLYIQSLLPDRLKSPKLLRSDQFIQTPNRDTRDPALIPREGANR